MGRFKRPPDGFSCPYRFHCPHIEEQNVEVMYRHAKYAWQLEGRHGEIRELMADENYRLSQQVKEQEKLIDEQAHELDELRAENRRLHLKVFRKKKKKPPADTKEREGKDSHTSSTQKKARKKRGAPEGHPPWTRKTPGPIDRVVDTPAPCTCPHCEGTTDQTRLENTSYIQEDIILNPQTVVTQFNHQTAWCPGCRKQVYESAEGELPFAPIGPNAKAAALYFRHELKLPYRKIQQAMSSLFGINFVPASTLGFERRARDHAETIFDDLVKRMRKSPVVHADETYWRQDGENYIVWYAGNENVALFHIDKHRSAEAAQELLGEKVDGLLVTDAYAAYNSIGCLDRQSCLAHLIRKADELINVLIEMKKPDMPSLTFCRKLIDLLERACGIQIPRAVESREELICSLLKELDALCPEPLEYGKAETLRKRLIPGAREYNELFTFIRHDGPPTNNHAERALRPLVIFRKVCMGSRSASGSENVALFTSLTQTAKLQGADLVNVFLKLFSGSPVALHDAIFTNST